MSEKKVWNIYHRYDVDGGFGDAVARDNHVATVMATEEEVESFIAKWSKPEIYDHPYADLLCHYVYAEVAEVADDISTVEPYSTDPNDWFNRGIREVKERLSE